MRKRWLQSALAIVLAVSMCLGLAPLDGLGGVFKAAETEESWVDTKLFTNGDFETGDATGWTVEDGDNGSKVWQDRDGDTWYMTNNQSYVFRVSVWAEGDPKPLSLSQTIKDVSAGTYRVSFEWEGDASSSGLTLSVNGTELTLPAGPGYNTWITLSSDEIILEDTDDITVTLSGEIPAGFWGDVDNFVLEKKVASDGIEEGNTEDGDDEKPTYEVTVTPDVTSVPFTENTVRLTATVTKDGEEIPAADMAKNNLGIWWWSDEWVAGHEDGKHDEVVSYPVSGSVLTVDVEFPYIGTYYMVGELYDTTSDSSLTRGYSTITVTELDVEEGDENDTGIYVKPILSQDSDFILGADVSSYLSVVNSGSEFYNWNGTKLSNQAFFNLLKNSGVNYIRLRVWNRPYDDDGNGYGGGNCDLKTAKIIGKWASDAGMKVLIDFHYSDFWADPKRQLVPKDWEGMTIDEKAKALSDYTKNSLNELIDAGVDVGMVQVGNETTNSICGENDWVNMAKLFNAGCNAVRAVDKDILIAIHIETPEKAKYEAYAENLEKYEVDYDVFASSYYPYWHCSTSEMKEALQNIVDKYQKQVMIAEVAWPFTLEDGDGTGNNIAAGTEPLFDFSPQGQADAVADVVKAMTDIGDDALGIFWWEPAWIPPQYAYNKDGSLNQEIYDANRKIQEAKGSGWASSYAAAYDTEPVGNGGGSSWDNQAWFDFNGRPLASLNTYKYLKSGALTNRRIVGASSNEDVTVKYGTSVEDIEKLLPGVTINYNYGGNVAASDKDVTWNVDEIAAATEKGAGSYTITGNVTFEDSEGRTYSGEVSFTLTIEYENLLADYNYSFEDGWTGWDLDGDKVDLEEHPNGDGGAAIWVKADDAHDGVTSLHYNKLERDFTVTQKITLDAGEYVFGGYLQGGDNSTGDVFELFIQIGDGERLTASATPSGWAAWKNPEIKNIVIPEDGTEVTIGIYVNAGASAWGTWDDLYIFDAADMPDVPDVPDEPDEPIISDNILENYDYSFENVPTKWNNVTGPVDIAEDTPHDGKKALHYWADKAFSFDVTQTIPLEAGEYRLGGYLQGDDAGADDIYELYIQVGDKEYKASATPSGHKNWQNPKISGIIVPEGITEVTIGIRVTGSAGAWGTWDDLYLFKIPETDEPTISDGPTIGQKPVEEVVTEIKSGKKEVTVDMKKADGSYDTVVPQDILAAAKGEDVVLTFDMGDYQWIIKGKDIKEAKPVDLEVTLKTKYIPSDLVSKIANGHDAIQLHLSYNGEFGFKATLKIKLDKKYTGQYGNLYYYNNGKLELLQAGKIDKDGYVSFEFDHASDYVIVIDKVNRIANPTDKTPTGDNSPIIPFAVLLFAATGMVGITAVRRRKVK